jgi:hypothetical protein
LQLEETLQLTEDGALSHRICKQEAPRPKMRSRGKERIRGAAHRPRTGGEIYGAGKFCTNKKEHKQSTQNAKFNLLLQSSKFTTNSLSSSSSLPLLIIEIKK